MYAQTNRSLHHNGWSTSSQTDLKADQLSSKASRGFHCKLMRCLLQCPCLSTDRALINQGNHKEIWERLCSKSPWDHKCTASKSVRPHYPSSLRFVLFVFLLLFFFLLFFFLPPSTSLHRLPCRHWFHRHFKITQVLMCTVTLNVHRFFFLDDCAKLEWNKWNTATVKSFTERGGECAVVAALHSHLLDLPFHYDAVVDTTDLINPLLMHAGKFIWNSLHLTQAWGEVGRHRAAFRDQLLSQCLANMHRTGFKLRTTVQTATTTLPW